jgi:hypothetical protein
MKSKNIKPRIGPVMSKALNFAIRHDGKWHAFARKCRSTKTAIERLATMGLVEIERSVNPALDDAFRVSEKGLQFKRK